MLKYKETDILRIAKRIGNQKRSYLMVNPLQAKHIPVSPSKALHMMTTLGEIVAKQYSNARLVIGFAETATAIGAVVAKTLSNECYYIQTTREIVKEAKNYICFSEEHSHATEQNLIADNLDDLFCKTETIILVDDEFSTGKTLINMLTRLRVDYPILKKKRIVAASIINRMSKSNITKWQDEGVESICLLKLENTDYSISVESIDVEPAVNCLNIHKNSDNVKSILHNLPDPRLGIVISDYYERCFAALKLIKSACELRGKKVLILGTEECMIPALLIGKEIEELGETKSVKCHATTRSPIGTSKTIGYPAQSGFKIHSFYDLQRDSYIYNLNTYDVAIIVSDTKASFKIGLCELSSILNDFGCTKIISLVGSDDV